MRALMAAALVAVALGAGACGGDDGDDAGPAGTTPAAPATGTTATATTATTGGAAVADDGDRRLIVQQGATAKALKAVLDQRSACESNACFLRATRRLGDVSERELPRLRAAIREATTPCLRRGGDLFAQALRAWVRSRDAADVVAFDRASAENVRASKLLRRSTGAC